MTRGAEPKPTPGAVVADVLVLRPLGLGGTVLGGAAYVLSLPVTMAFHKEVRPSRFWLVTLRGTLFNGLWGRCNRVIEGGMFVVHLCGDVRRTRQQRLRG